MTAALVIVLVSFATISCAIPLDSKDDNIKARGHELGNTILKQSTDLKNNLNVYLGIKLWRSIYEKALANSPHVHKSGRELTAENCAVCAAEEEAEKAEKLKKEEAERVQNLKNFEAGVKGATDIISAILGPISNFFKGSTPAVTKNGKGRNGARFSNLANILSKNMKNSSTPFDLLISPYVEEIGDLGVYACSNGLKFNMQRATETVHQFCKNNSKKIFLVKALDLA